MRFSVIFFNFLMMVVIILVSMDAATTPASAALVLLPGRRSMGKWSHSYHSPQGDQNVKGLSSHKVGQIAGNGVKPINKDNPKGYFTETPHSSNMDVEEIVYTIDYHGATTHPTPTPKHPTP